MDALLLLQRAEEGYTLEERALPELEDLREVTGELGVGYRGGLLAVDGYRNGGRLDVRWVDEGGTGVPTDEEGLILWSFYAHMVDFRDELGAQGVDVEPLFPVRFTWSPVSVLDFAAVENAAYAPVGHVFVLFPDLLREGVPLAANEGVVRHELGHALFQWIAVGELRVAAPWDADDPAGTTAMSIRALNEGFADSVATLSLDAPDFLSDSLPMPARDVREEHVATPSMYPTEETSPLLYDPYPLGSVFAALAWDVGGVLGREEALLAVVRALGTWAAEDTRAIDRYAVLLVEEAVAVDPDAADPVCDALALRFPHLLLPEVCG